MQPKQRKETSDTKLGADLTRNCQKVGEMQRILSGVEVQNIPLLTKSRVDLVSLEKGACQWFSENVLARDDQETIVRVKGTTCKGGRVVIWAQPVLRKISVGLDNNRPISTSGSVAGLDPLTSPKEYTVVSVGETDLLRRDNHEVVSKLNTKVTQSDDLNSGFRIIDMLLLQESKSDSIDIVFCPAIWSHEDFDWIANPDVNTACGLLCVWRSVFTLEQNINGQGFKGLKGK